MIGYRRTARGDIEIFRSEDEGLRRAQDEIAQTLAAENTVTVYTDNRFPFWSEGEKK